MGVGRARRIADPYGNAGQEAQPPRAAAALEVVEAGITSHPEMRQGPAHGRRTASFDGVDRKPRPAVEDGGVGGGGQDRGAALVFLDAADDGRGDHEVPECPPLEDERAVAWSTGHRSGPRAARAPRNSGRYTAKGLER